MELEGSTHDFFLPVLAGIYFCYKQILTSGQTVKGA